MITNHKQIVARYRAITSDVRKAAAKSPDRVDVHGDSYQVKADLGLSEGTVKAGSHFDNDPSTRDKVVLVDGNQTQTFEDYSVRRGWLFKHDVETMKFSQFDQAGSGLGGFSSSSTTFQV